MSPQNCFRAESRRAARSLTERSSTIDTFENGYFLLSRRHARSVTRPAAPFLFPSACITLTPRNIISCRRMMTRRLCRVPGHESARGRSSATAETRYCVMAVSRFRRHEGFSNERSERCNTRRARARVSYLLCKQGRAQSSSQRSLTLILLCIPHFISNLRNDSSPRGRDQLICSPRAAFRIRAFSMIGWNPTRLNSRAE